MIKCEKCETKNNLKNVFCKSCGDEIRNNAKIGEFSIYAKDLMMKKGLFSSGKYDIFVDEEKLVVIELPSFWATLVGSLAGLVILNIIGLIIGFIAGQSSDNKKRNAIRRTWLKGSNDKISEDYEAYKILEIPISKIGDILSIKGRTVQFNFEKKKLVFIGKKKEIIKFVSM